MGSAALLYARAPQPVRGLMATARGMQLHLWRYGRDLERLVAEAAERDTWSPERWRTFHEERLGALLHRAATRVPYYREAWAARRRNGDRSSWDDLANWPLLPKDDVRATPSAFLADGARRPLLFEEHTSGTTGSPLTLWQDRDAVKAWYALFEWRARRWNGVALGVRWGIVGGQLVVPVERHDPPFWVWNGVGRQLYLSAFHVSTQNIGHYAEAMRRSRIEYLVGYPSALAAMAEAADERGVALPELRAVLSNAEPLLDAQRARISGAFGADVRNTYGMSEAVTAATECDHGRLHLWPDAGITEVVDDDTDAGVPVGAVGRLVCTGLLNSAMPLIRYVCGDRGSIGPSTCGCGRTLPELRSIEGRSDDVVIGSEGQIIGRLDGIFKADLAVREAQIIQHDIGAFEIVYRPSPSASDEVGHQLAAALRDRVGPAEVVTTPVDRIPRTSAGKFRAVTSHVGRDGRRRP